ncbi:thiamine diphosphokinase [Dethiosulfovibrio salsuginis]|uniref:Thiamine diphosphokinase n=1 Tax=Dethiosulfovibrio salsuginis TaxID=561720 RepID=A0A1X7I4B9_9BACT|nr:thiamine diphosphokinase [Dethiosulfovibrio salsuginis]SMG08831.1 thiamine pyrophosphokinase [Dethiosulfovibrio salsuginis]
MKSAVDNGKFLGWKNVLVELKAPNLPEEDVLLVSGGRGPDPHWLRTMAETRRVWAIDSGADYCKEASVVPEMAIGDFDSIANDTMDWLISEGVKMDTYSWEKDITDLQISLDLCDRLLSPVFGTITGIWGGRFDHVWSSINSILRHNVKGSYFRFLGDNMEMMIIVRGGESLVLRHESPSPLDIVSLLPLSDLCDGVSIKGVKWPLEKVSLSRDYPYSISNFPVEDTEVALESGWMGVYLKGR